MTSIGNFPRLRLLAAALVITVGVSLLVGTYASRHSASAAAVILEVDTARDVTILGGGAGDKSGFSVASGDLNNDGVGDLIIGALEAAPLGRGFAGATYVIFGPIGVGTLDLSGASHIVAAGASAGELSGSGVAVADFNNDGVDDLAIGAPRAAPGGKTRAGRTHVVFGPLTAGPLDLATASDLVVNGVAASDISGFGVVGGDVNNDGIRDLIIGAQNAGGGKAYVLLGPLSQGTIELSDGADITINAAAAGDALGTGLGVGDVNDDGVNDVLVGAPAAQSNVGRSYVLFGPLAPGTVELSSGADIVLDGIAASDSSGYDAEIGDADNDGIADLLLGSSLADPGGRNAAGQVHVVFGPLSGGVLQLAADADLAINGIDPIDQLVSSAIADLNNDGALDVIVGAYEASPEGRSKAGETYVIFGDTPPTTTPIPGTSTLGLFLMIGILSVLFGVRLGKNRRPVELHT